MQYEEFIHRVQSYAGLDSPEEAERLTQIVLSTLGEPLYRTARDRLSAQLPQPLEGMFFHSQPAENLPRNRDSYPVEEFYKRIRARADVSLETARQQSRAVMRTVQEAVTPAVITEMLQELPDDYRELVTAPEG